MQQLCMHCCVDAPISTRRPVYLMRASQVQADRADALAQAISDASSGQVTCSLLEEAEVGSQ
jgi:hypothetical protein